jgi:hypothetical protein
MKPLATHYRVERFFLVGKSRDRVSDGGAIFALAWRQVVMQGDAGAPEAISRACEH